MSDTLHVPEQQYKFPIAKVGDIVEWHDHCGNYVYSIGEIELTPYGRKFWDANDDSYLLENDADNVTPPNNDVTVKGVWSINCIPEHVKHWAIEGAVHYLETYCRHWASKSKDKLTIEHLDQAKKEMCLRGIAILKEFDMIDGPERRESYVIKPEAKMYLEQKRGLGQ